MEAALRIAHYLVTGKEMDNLNVPAVRGMDGVKETTVKIGDEFGLGGPNQEFALSAACEIAGLDQVLVAGIDSDGTDGPTDFAGAIVDGGTLKRAQAAGIDVHASLKRHDVTPALRGLGDIVQTGATGTNVNDLKMLMVMSAEDSA